VHGRGATDAGDVANADDDGARLRVVRGGGVCHVVTVVSHCTPDERSFLEHREAHVDGRCGAQGSVCATILVMSNSPAPRSHAADSQVASLKGRMSAVPRAALGNLIAKLAIVGLGLAITVVVARMGPTVQGAFALFVAVESGLLTLFSGLGLWLARQVSRQVDGRAWPALPMMLGVLRAAVLLGGLAALGLLAVSWQTKTLPYSQLWLLALGAPFCCWCRQPPGFGSARDACGPSTSLRWRHRLWFWLA